MFSKIHLLRRGVCAIQSLLTKVHKSEGAAWDGQGWVPLDVEPDAEEDSVTENQ